MLRTRPVWMRGLRLYRSMASAGPLDGIAVADDLFDARVHARSRIRSEAVRVERGGAAAGAGSAAGVTAGGVQLLPAARGSYAHQQPRLTVRRVARPASAGRRPGDRPPAVARAPARPPATLRAGPDSACPDRPRRSPRTNPGTRRTPGDASRRERSRRGRSARSPARAVG